MKKILLTVSAVCLTATMMAGGLVTNTNHSAAFTRLMCRDASLDADAAYFNPAGTVMMKPGLHLSISSQTISQTRWIETNFPTVNGVSAGTPREFQGEVFAPVFPAVYGVFNLGKIAVSAGFNPIGGGGGATFSEGIPQLEYDPSLLVPALASAGVTGYELDASFEGSSIYFGYQLNVAYKINDKLSVAVGGRFVTAKNTYTGYLTNVNLNWMGTMTPVAGVFGGLADNFEAIAATGPTLQPIIDGGGGDFTLQQLLDNTIIDAPTKAQLEAGLGVIGVADPSAMTLTQIQGAFNTAAPTMLLQAATMDGKAAVYGSLMDQEADVLQTAKGFAPIFSINFSPIEMLNIAIKYEGKTSLKFKNETASDFITAVDAVGTPTASMFPDGYEYNADIPAQLTVGVMLRPIDRLMLTAGVNTFFDQAIDYSSGMDIDMIDKNYVTYAFGAEFGLTEALKVSAGYSGTSTGVNELYQSDIRHSLNTSSFGGGFMYSIGSMIDINVGGQITTYADESYDKVKTPSVGTPINYIENYDRAVWLFGVGVDLHF